MRALVVFFSLSVSFFCIAQDTCSRSEYIQDLSYYNYLINFYHPKPFLFKDSVDFRLDIAKLKQEEFLSDKDFYVQLLKINNQLRDGHLYVQQPQKAVDGSLSKKKFLPFSVRIVDFNLFVNQSSVNGLKKWDLITSINGVPSSDIIYQTLPLLPVDGFAVNRKYKNLEMYFPVLYSWVFELQDLNEVEVISSQGLKAKHKLIFEPVTGFNANRLVQQKVNKWRYSVDEERALSYLEISSFNSQFLPEGQKFSAYLKSKFKNIREKSVNDLVVDLRGNEGGSVEHMKSLLSYLKTGEYRLYGKLSINNYLLKDTLSLLLPEDLKVLDRQKIKSSQETIVSNKKLLRAVKESKSCFKGNVVLLVDGNTFSSASHLVSLLKGQSNVHVIGEETGGNQSFCNAGYTLRAVLPNTKIKVHIPLIHGDYGLENNINKGVQPDTDCSPDVLSYMRFKDPCVLTAFEYLELIKKNHDKKEK